MKNIKTFESYIPSMRVYHGTPYRFTEFNDDVTFFSETEKFAARYGNTKASDFGIEDGIRVFQCELSGNIFDIKDPVDYAKLEAALPDTVKVNYLFMSANIDKEELLRNLQGKLTIKPKAEVLDALTKLYDTVRFNGGDVICIDLDEQHVKTASYSSFCEAKEGFGGKRDGCDKLPEFVAYKERAVAYMKEKEPETNWAFMAITNPKGFLYYLSQSDGGKQIMNECYPPALEAVRQMFLAEDRYENHYREAYVDDIESTWTFYENDTVIDIIRKLGYDGWKATEGDTTYALFNAKKTTKNCELIKNPRY